jgi:hypothetical protein
MNDARFFLIALVNGRITESDAQKKRPETGG